MKNKNINNFADNSNKFLYCVRILILTHAEFTFFQTLVRFKTR